jgi:hypothetical protein
VHGGLCGDSVRAIVRRAHTALALLGAAVALLASAGPGWAHSGAGSSPGHAAAKTKPKPVKCKASQTRVTTKGRVRCVTLPRSRPLADNDLALFTAVVRRDIGPARNRHGRRAPKFWQGAGGRLKAVRARLLKALPKALALSRRTATARTSASGSAVSCNDLERANVPDQQGSFDGFSVSTSATGEVNMSVSAGSGYRVEVVLAGQMTCSNLDLPQCPMPDGVLEGKDTHSSVVGLRVTKDGALVQSFRTTVRSTQTMRGQVAVDAKLDQMNFKDVARETTTVQVPGATLVLNVGIEGTAVVKMRTGAIENAQVRASFSVRGGSQADGFAATDRASGEYVQRFPRLVNEERDNYRQRETAWQTPGACAKVVFAPPTDTTKVPKGIQGTVTPHVEANAGGTAAKAKWTLSDQEKGTFSPAEVEAPSPAISYTPTGEDKQKLKAKFRATSTAGVAEDSWQQEIEDRVRYFKVTGLVYTDQLALDGLPPIGTCTASTSQTNTTTFQPSSDPWDGAVGQLGPSPTGPRGGSLIAKGDVLSTAAFSGCELNMDGTAYVSCSEMSAGSFLNVVILDVELPDSGPAKLTWHPLPPRVGDVPPRITPCIVFGGQPTGPPEPVTRTEPVETFMTPGPHTVSLDLSRDVPASGAGTLHSIAHYALTFHRVNADGSPYTG